MAFERRLELNKSTEINRDEEGDSKPKTTKATVEKQKSKSNIFNGNKRSANGSPAPSKNVERSRSETKVDKLENLAKAAKNDDN